MCGICGILNFDGAPVSDKLLLDMNNAMKLRGPDDSGHYVELEFGMAMRRLSIIDVGGGQQPICNEDNTIHVVLNGEIYNYIELRRDLENRGHLFKTKSDTEVLVHLYEEYGVDAVKHLNGMFAFAIWDSPRKRLWVVRDRLGIKPLVYFKSQRGFVFASTLEALASHPDFKKEVDHDSLLLYFMLSYVPNPSTIWKKAKKLPPGHWLLVENSQVRIEQYWNLEPHIHTERNQQFFVEEIQEIIKDSIDLHSRSDVPVGTFLSGGIDSSAVTSLFCERSNNAVHTFTMDFDGKDIKEGHYAKLVADQYKTQHHFQVLNLDSALKELDELLPFMDEPMADSAIIPSYILSKMAREKDIKVILGGAGGDELFGGYQRHYPALRDKFAGRLTTIPLQFWKILSRAINPRVGHYGGITWDKGVAFGTSTSGVNLGFLEKLFCNYKEYLRAMELTRSQFYSLSKMEKIWGFGYGRMLMDVQNYLVDNVLAIADQCSMAASVESRVPLLDYRLAEFAFSVSEKTNMGESFDDAKISLKKAFKSKLPSRILNRPKAGFNGPVYDWIYRKHPRFEERIFSPKSLDIQNLFDPDAIKKIWANDSHRVAACETFFMIYVADMWLETHA